MIGDVYLNQSNSNVCIDLGNMGNCVSSLANMERISKFFPSSII